MPAKLADPVDPATSIHLHRGDLGRARTLAQQRGASVASVLRDLVRDALDAAEQRGTNEHDAPLVELHDIPPLADDLDAFVDTVLATEMSL